MQHHPRVVAGIPWPDLVLAAVIAVAAVLSTVMDPGTVHPLAEIIAGVVASSLVLRTTAPLAMTGVVVVGIVALAFLPSPSTPLWAFAAYLVVAYSIAVHATGTRRVIALICLLAAGYLIQARDPHSSPVEVVVTPLILTAAPALAGWLLARSREQARRLRELTAQLEDSRARVAELSAAAERNRIARDLHDMLGHTLSSIAVQAGAAGELLGPEAPAAGPVERIRQAAHEGLDEVRALLSAETHPVHGSIAALAAEDGAQLTVTGEPRPLPPHVDEAAYRIVQEALTNARRHAAGEAVEVTMDHGPDALRIRVHNGGQFPPVPREGHGVPGMRTRAAACGGTASAGADDAGWTVRALLPLAPVSGGGS